MVGYDSQNNALTLGDDDSLKVGDYELQYDSTSDEFQAEYGRPIGGELGNHGEIRGATYTKDNQIGEYALDFSESNSFVETDFIQNLSSFTVSTFIKNGEATDRIFGSASPRIDFQIANSGVGLFINDNQDNFVGVVSTTDPQDGEWYHVAVTWNGVDKLEIFIDGTLENSSTSTITGEVNQRVNIGKRNSESKYFSGKIDDLRFFNKVLTSTQITDLSNKVDVTDGLVAQWDFEFPETPNVAIDSTGEAFPKNSIPRSTSGSLVPQGFADVLSQGEVLADNGEIYTSVQTAVDNSTGFVFIGPGTFNEAVTISTQGLTLQGSGYDTLIDGGSSNAITIDSSNITISDLRVTSTDPNADGITDSINASSALVQRCYALSSGEDGIGIRNATDSIVQNCVIGTTGSGHTGIDTHKRMIVRGCYIDGASIGIRILSDDVIVTNNIITNTNRDGIQQAANPNDCIIISNRVHNSGEEGIKVDGLDNIVANNRISDSGNSDINDTGTGTVLDDNLTGPSN